MYKLVLIRHGESVWNKENRFTGWVDVNLSEKGIWEAHEAGKLLMQQGFVFGLAYTSYLKRAIHTLHHILDEMDLSWIEEKKTWRLNEKHYGILQGLNKSEMVEKYGEQQVLLWRRSYDIAPPPLEKTDPMNPCHDLKYKNFLEAQAQPSTESLQDTVDRIIPFWEQEISVALKQHQQILVAAHGNSLRGIIKHLKKISNEDIIALNLPTAVPFVIELNQNLEVQKDYFLGDPEEIRKKMEAVANQTKKAGN